MRSLMQMMKGLVRGCQSVLAAGIFAFAVTNPALADTVAFNTSLADPGVYFGTGNANAGFTTLTTSNGIELGLGVEIRGPGGGPVLPTPTSGSALYVVPTGGTGTALWNYEFSVNLGNSGLTLGNLQSATISINDISTGQTASYNALALPDNAGLAPG